MVTKHKRSFLLLLCLGIFPHESLGLPTGAPPTGNICEKMLPGHNKAAQSIPSPYNISISNNNLMGGDKLIINLRASDTDFFKGFLVLVKKSGDANKTFGQFSSSGGGTEYQVINCFEQKDSAATHKNNTNKTNITLEWIAPNEEDLNDLEVVVTFVKVVNVIWQAVKHPEKITVKRNHDLMTPTSVKGKLSPATIANLKELYSPCMKEKAGCLELPTGCIKNFLSVQSTYSKICNVILTWTVKGDRNVYKMAGKPGDETDTKGFIAMGFSDDQLMSKDSVVGCFISASGGQPKIRRFKNTDQLNLPNDDPNLGLKAIEARFTEGHIFCQFEQTDHSIPNIIDIKLRGKSYYILLSKGSNAGDNTLSYHGSTTKDKVVSNKALSVNDYGIQGASSSFILIHLHGSCMIFAWLISASIGTFTARYYKLTFTQYRPCFDKALWYNLHVSFMVTTVLLTAFGALFIIIKLEGWSHSSSLHPILGVLLICLSIFQVIVAILRPHPGKYRIVFNWIHWTVGNSTHIIGFSCIFLAIELPAAQLNTNYFSVILSALILHIIFHLILSFHTLWSDKQMDSKTLRAIIPGPMKSNGLFTEAPGTVFRSVLIALYSMILFSCAIALICFIGDSNT